MQQNMYRHTVGVLAFGLNGNRSHDLGPRTIVESELQAPVVVDTSNPRSGKLLNKSSLPREILIQEKPE